MKKRVHEMTDTVEVSKEEDEEVGGSDEEAPDAVSFNQSKQEALESMTNALRDLKRTKLKAKERRRERDKLLKEQKQKKKKVSLSKARLSPEFLDNLSQEHGDATTESSEKPQDQLQTQSPRKLTDSLSEDSDEDCSDEDFRAEEVHPPTIQVVQTSKIDHPPPHEAALAFRQKEMYGQRISRVSMSKYVSRNLKNCGMPGLNFSSTRKEERKKKPGSKR